MSREVSPTDGRVAMGSPVVRSSRPHRRAFALSPKCSSAPRRTAAKGDLQREVWSQRAEPVRGSIVPECRAGSNACGSPRPSRTVTRRLLATVLLSR